MTLALLTTKLYPPVARTDGVVRARLLTRLNAGLLAASPCNLSLVCAPAGFGKTTLVSQWLASIQQPVAWLSLDEDDNDSGRFLSYFVSALQTLQPDIGEGVLAMLQSSQVSAPETLLTMLVNDLADVSAPAVLVLDDYHVIDNAAVDDMLRFVVAHLPPTLHLVITTREDPQLPLARLRARGQLNELRAQDVRFTADESAAFLNDVMDLDLSEADIQLLETRTEGWIAGLQLAALSLQGQADAHEFITSFTGSHRFVLDYLITEVLHQQADEVQTFLLRTAVLERFCGTLCDAVVGLAEGEGQTLLERLERANVFLVPLDSERQWYRYHHLFGELLQQRLMQHKASSGSAEVISVNDLHLRASIWYERAGLDVAAFQHAAKAGDVALASRLIEGGGTPIHFRGVIAPVLTWLGSLDDETRNAHPSLWVMYASALSMTGQNSQVESALTAAERAIYGLPEDDSIRNLIGHIAAIRGLLAATQHDVQGIIQYSQKALDYLHETSTAVRTATTWKLGLAYQMQGQRAAARQAYQEAIAMCEASGNVFINVVATTGLGIIYECDTQLADAETCYSRVLDLAGDPPRPTACEAYIGLARTYYAQNKLTRAENYAQTGLALGKRIEMIDNFIDGELILARLKLVQSDSLGAARLLDRTAREIQQKNFIGRLPDVVDLQVTTLLEQGKYAEAAQLAQSHDVPLSQVRLFLVEGQTEGALEHLTTYYSHVSANHWLDEQLKTRILQTLAFDQLNDDANAQRCLEDALSLASAGGYIRLFVDEDRVLGQGKLQKRIATISAQGQFGEYLEALVAAFEEDHTGDADKAISNTAEADKQVQRAAELLLEPLTARELDVLTLVAEGLSNRDIGARLFRSLDTIKGHNRRIFGKLQVRNRTEAVAKARELGLL
ncbi:MAG: LuxR C-terminal-related transcriptional regulator [Deinococcota bacterium]